MNIGILGLPKNVLVYAFSFLKKRDLENCLLTCKRFRECTYQNLGKELFLGLTTRTVYKFINGPYLKLVGDFVMPIGLKREWDRKIEILLRQLKNNEIEKKVKVRSIKISKRASTKKSLTEIFTLDEEIKKTLKMITVQISNFKVLNHLLELQKQCKIPVRISVKISPKYNDKIDFNQKINLWKEKLKDLPQEIQLYELGLNCDKAEKIREICNNFKVTSLFLQTCLHINLSACESLLEVTIDDARSFRHINVILPKQLKSLKIKAWSWLGNGVDASCCTALNRCDITNPQGSGKLILSKSIKDTVILTSRYDKDAEWKIELV